MALRNNEKCDQAGVARRIRLRNHDARFQSGMGVETIFDLPRFDAIAPNFHLPIQPADELDVAIGQTFDKITGAIKSLALACVNGDGYELFARQFRVVQIALSQAGPAQIEFAGHSGRNTITLGVEYVRQWCPKWVGRWERLLPLLPRP